MPRIREEIIYPELSYVINGLCFIVQNQLGRYRNERQYGDYLETLLRKHGIGYQREAALMQSFPGERMNRNRPDFFIDGKIILDIKAKRLITRDDYFQMRRYLVSSGKRLGLLVNFQTQYVTIKRVLNSYITHPA